MKQQTDVPGRQRSHPRPDFRRADDRWTSLDGLWELALGGAGSWRPVQVPAPWESELSGVGAHWVDHARYRRPLSLPPTRGEESLVLHFQAVQHRAEVLLDGRLLGTHVGGQLPFEVEVTELAGRDVELEVRVEAPVDKAQLPHGKQRSIPADPYDGCSFTPCSGIWQSVWLERRPITHLRRAAFVPAATLDRFAVRTETVGRYDRITVQVVGSGERVELDPAGSGELVLDAPRVWRPEDPQLYELLVRVHRSGEVLDEVRCTTGLRTVEVADGVLRLNGERVHLRGVLDQGYWPSSGWTAPDDTALEADLLAARAAGFTMVRKHLKLEDPRWLHAADRLGMLVWAEPPCVSRFSAESVAAFEAQLTPMVERDRNHPSIIIWGVYNEEWGLDWDVEGDASKAEALRRGYEHVKRLDPSRPVVDNSGWSHVRTDLLDWHVYAPDLSTWRATLDSLDQGFDVHLGVEGGRQHKNLFADKSPSAGHALLNSEYGTGHTSVERAWVMRWQTQELRRDDRSNGYVYCELYDIEHEIAGVLTSERRTKDDLGLSAGDTHAQTVLVLDLLPRAPGADLVTADGLVELAARVSSHADVPRDLRLLTAWGPVLGPDPGPTGAGVAGQVRVDPFVLSGPVQVRTRLPAGTAAARLHLWAVPAGAAGAVAHTSLDVRLEHGTRSLH